MKQKDVFLESEGNAWFRRNANAVGTRTLPDGDPLLVEILRLSLPETGTKILEIGCGEGTRLRWLKEHGGFDCYGVEPSAEAVEAAKGKGVTAHRGTADRLPFEDGAFDVVMFGFCLYLCDREDLFRIAYEADRVLKNPGWLLILDFYSPVPLQRPYHHRPGVLSHKMDYRTLFTWNPCYTTASHQVRHHTHDTYTDDPQEWVAISVLRKNLTHHD
jgi:ubiquinone/menaquinone biosynthesis C-methylase UbiE